MQPIDFTPQEVLTYLPSGWRISDPEAYGTWLDKKQLWKLRLQDGADVEWSLQISSDDVVKLGRIEALKLALIRLQTSGLA